MPLRNIPKHSPEASYKSYVELIHDLLYSWNLESSLYSRIFLWLHHWVEQWVIKATLAAQPGFNGIQKPPPAHSLQATRNSRLNTSFCPSQTTPLLLLIRQNCNRRTCSTITGFSTRAIWKRDGKIPLKISCITCLHPNVTKRTFLDLYSIIWK